MTFIDSFQVEDSPWSSLFHQNHLLPPRMSQKHDLSMLQSLKYERLQHHYYALPTHSQQHPVVVDTAHKCHYSQLEVFILQDTLNV